MGIRINLNDKEIGLLLKGLDSILKRVALARGGTYHSRIPALDTGKDLFASRLYDGAMQQRLVSAYGKLRTIPPSRKLRMNVFELASCALSLRVVQSQDLEKRKEIDLELASKLKSKIENHRKKAKRALIKEMGAEGYEVLATKWRRHLQWLRHDILYRPRRRWPRGISMLRKENRERMRSLALQVVVDSVDHKQVFYWADLARRELRRLRHGVSLLALLKNEEETKRFLADFILKRSDLETIRPEFVPPALRGSLRSEKYRAALTVESPSTPNPVASGETPRPSVSEGIVSSGIQDSNACDVGEPSVPSPRKALPKEELITHIAEWLTDEVDPGFWEPVAQEIQEQVSRFPESHKLWADSHRDDTDPVESSRPRDDDDPAMIEIAIYADWGAKWLFALNPDWRVIYSAAIPGYLLASKNRKKELDRRWRQERVIS